jgi:hypothetical protein
MRLQREQADIDHAAALQQREAELQSRLRELQDALVLQRQLLETAAPSSAGGQR